MPDLSLTVPVYINLDPSGPVLVRSSTNQLPLGPLRVVSGDKRLFSFRLHQTPEGDSWQRVGLPEGWTMVLSGKRATGGETAYFTNSTWAEVGSGTTLAYTATLDFAVADAVWGTPPVPSLIFKMDIEIRDATNTVRGTVQFDLELSRENYGSGDTPDDPDSPFLDRPSADNIYVSFAAAQTLTEEQKAQARANIGAADASNTFDPASPGPIGGTTPNTIKGTSFTAGTFGVTPQVFFTQNDITGRDSAGNDTFYFDSATGAGTCQTLTVGNGGATFNGAVRVNADMSVTSFRISDGATDYAIITDDGSATFLNLAVAGGGFFVDETGAVTSANVTANGHFKSQGSGGAAGSLVLTQGTAPNGTGSTTTLWGISGGIGYRNGTGTAYSLTLPTASGTLALVDGNLGTPTTLTLTNATGLPVAGGGTGASTALQARINLGLTRMSPVHGGDGSWVTATVSGTVGTNTYFGGTRTGQVASATAGVGRFYYNAANSSNIYTGSRTVVNWSGSFRVDFRALIYVNTNASSKITFLVATGTATAAHDLAALGLAVQAYGNGSACRIRLQAHNGSSATNGTDVAWTAGDDNFYDFSLVWTAGTGATLYKDDVSLCSISTGLPSGNGASGATCPMFLFENGSGSSDVTNVRLMSLTARR